MRYCFGIDAGGTKTACAIGDSAGNLISVGIAGPANYKLVGPEVAKKNILQAIRQAQTRGNIFAGSFDYGLYALAGLDGDRDLEIIDDFISEINPARHYSLENDAIASLALGSSSGYGVVLICGTGSNCVAVNEKNERIQVGGLGREFGDFSGGREIATLALASAVRGFDGRGPHTILYDLITNYLSIDNFADFSPILHHSDRAYPIANLVPLVFEAAEQGDAVATGILRYNGEELAISAEVAIERIFAQSPRIEVILTGGIFKGDRNQILTQALKEKLQSRFSKVEFKEPTGEPVIGALIQALRKNGLEVTENDRNKLIEEYELNHAPAEGA